jgi:MFS family permease
MNSEKKYIAGTLQYSFCGVLTLFFWLLWGDFCFSLISAVIPRLLPITLKDMGASNVFIGIIVGSIPSMMNMVINPIISVSSDRHRGPLGRRIPFLLWPSPFIAISLILLGYAPQIGGWLNTNVFSHLGLASGRILILGLVCLLTIAFQFFFLFVSSIYYYLFADVVPSQLLGRFMAWFRIVGTAAGFIFHRYIFGFADRYLSLIYLGIGLFFCVSFILMCLKVKEGQYPPPSPKVHGGGLAGSVKSFVTECCSHSIYIWFFMASAIFTVSLGCTQAFLIFFPRDTLHMSLDDIGKVTGWAAISSIPALMVMGWASDKYHPLRVNIVGTITYGIVNLLSFFLMRDPVSYTVWTLISSAILTIWAASNLPMFIAILPKQNFGQFSAATAIANSIGLVLGNVAAGWFMDWVADYRYQFIFNAVFATMAFIPTYMVYHEWRKHGGPDNYVAPTVVPILSLSK